MRNNTWKKAVISALTTIVGLTFTGLFFSSTVKADNYQPQDETALSSVNNVMAKNYIAPIQEFLTVKLYPHQFKNRNAVTLHFQNIPLLTFLDTSDHSALESATKLAFRLDQLSQQSIDANQINLSWNPNTKDYSLKFQEEELVRINQNIILPDSTKNVTNDALQATNRLRRLMGNAAPLTVVQNKVIITTDDDKINSFIGVKSFRKAAQGIASWYGPGFHGRRTASGERYNQHDFTAAHRSLPFGTRVQVTNLRNGRSVVVRINDRGPHVRGRILDLSAGAARAIGVKNTGVAPIVFQVVAY
ncbi:septal ring lytic transglycosylase RlpA family protein [Geminocystis sp. GBBB08]|uniref:septal ring lytic transglycosylase RlpA family protein n=1 Tax=Geminocystis sp. GBBB08 TaxID=2604140 RepID=UPI0027E38F4E|nr:septal ring lytic transglycosylase RlpA family protein [Geminocystis sp. GBBB08]MBL1210166.1 septal ring lytic transglycosylase RlpA family protein [Geminocystis sp. GBBB08]